MKATSLARWERRLRPLITKLPPETVVRKYSQGRLDFLSKLKQEIPSEAYTPPEGLSRELWGIKFRSPIMNSAGMFKNGECYEMISRQGAGAYLAGTGTWNSRMGNEKNGICLPFVTYPRSHSASNWLGLPNAGDEVNSKRAAKLRETSDIPIGWSVMGSPDLQGETKLFYFRKSMMAYELSLISLKSMKAVQIPLMLDLKTTIWPTD